MALNKRDNSIDIARAIAIVMMVMGHCDNVGNVDHFVSLFHISVFVFISGYLFKNNIYNNFKDFLFSLFKKIRKLYLFYVFYEILFFVLKNFLFNISFYSTNVSYGGKYIAPINSLYEFFREIVRILFGLGREPFCGAFWYIISLMIIISIYTLMNYYINKHFREKRLILLNIISIILFGIGFIMQLYCNIPRLAPAMTLLLIYNLGHMSKIINNKFNKYYLIPLCILLLVIINKYLTVSMNSNYYSNIILFLMASILGIYLVMCLSKLFNKIPIFNSVLIYIGKNTLPIMGLHFISFKIAMYTQIVIYGYNYDNIALLKGFENDNYWFVIYVIIGISIPLLINYVSKTILIKLKHTKSN